MKPEVQNINEVTMDKERFESIIDLFPFRIKTCIKRSIVPDAKTIDHVESLISH